MVNSWKKLTECYERVGIDEENNNKANKISVIKTFWNIVSCTSGVVMLGIPYVIKSGGWLSVIALVFVAGISNYTAQILIKCHYEEIRIENSDKTMRIRTRFIINWFPSSPQTTESMTKR